MELRNLITFIHVAELGSFTKTAEQLGYSQSTVSFQIKQLEDELGCMLFERINHTITLTERGHELVSYAHQVRALTEDFRESLMREEECRGHIHIVTPDSVCEEMIYAHYLDFHKQYPLISIKFTTADTTVMFDMLDHNEADIVCTLDNHIYDTSYVISGEEKMGAHFICSAHSPLAARESLDVTDLLSEPFMLTEKGMSYRRLLDEKLAERSLEISPMLELGSADLICRLVGEGAGLSFLPDYVTEKAARDGAIVRLPVRDLDISLWKQVIYHKDKWITPPLQAVIDYLSCR